MILRFPLNIIAINDSSENFVQGQQLITNNLSYRNYDEINLLKFSRRENRSILFSYNNHSQSTPKSTLRVFSRVSLSRIMARRWIIKSKRGCPRCHDKEASNSCDTQLPTRSKKEAKAVEDWLWTHCDLEYIEAVNTIEN
jgi:hypothetical protein